MVEEANIAEEAVIDAEPAGEGRDRSTVKFPYFDLDDVVEVASVLLNKRGGSCETSELAAELDQSVTGGTFRLRMSAARMYGLIDGRGQVRLTPLGRRIVDPSTARAARVEAFLKVPLYFQIYEEFKSGTLPGAEGLEAAMNRHGVTINQLSRARQTFQRAAQQAGFFDTGRSRLVKPPVSNTVEVEQQDQQDDHAQEQNSNQTRQDRGGDGDPLSDPMLVGLLKRMLPEEGKPFPAANRRLLFTALAVNLDVIYGAPTDGTINADELAKLYEDSAKQPPASRPVTA